VAERFFALDRPCEFLAGLVVTAELEQFVSRIVADKALVPRITELDIHLGGLAVEGHRLFQTADRRI